MKRPNTIVAAAGVVCASALVTGGVLVAIHPPEAASATAASETVRTTTAAVEKGELRGTTTKTGTLGGTKGSSVKGGPAGTLTSLPEVGDVIKPGEALYRVDDVPVVLFQGVLPQWRAFQTGMSDGPDVLQLEENLHRWGYLTEAPTAHFDWATASAIRRWQKATGQPQTGSVERGRLWFGQGDQVVSDRALSVGDTVSPGAPVYTSTGTTKVVTVPLPLGSPLAKVGGLAEVRLPTGVRANGKVTTIGDPSTDDAGKTTVPVVVAFDDPKQVAGLDRIDVPVDFVTEAKKDVLSVPVTALGAKAGGGFVVQAIGRSGATKSVPVGVGLFAGDRVEITSGGLSAGQRVVVPA